MRNYGTFSIIFLTLCFWNTYRAIFVLMIVHEYFFTHLGSQPIRRHVVLWWTYLFKPNNKFAYFWPKFPFLTKISVFDQNFRFWPKFPFLTKISIFDQNFSFWPKFLFLTKIAIFDQNLDFLPKLRFLNKNLDFWHTFPFLT